MMMTNSVSSRRTAILVRCLMGLLVLLLGAPRARSSSDAAFQLRRDDVKAASTFTVPVTAASAAGDAGRRFKSLTFSTKGDGRSSSTTALLKDREAFLRRNHEQQHRLGERDLIYRGKPTGGNKYKSLVSMWLGTVGSSPDEPLNATLLTPNVCHGVMISDDVFITHRACAAVISVFPVVMIGDYDSTLPNLEDSVQLREVADLAVEIEHTMTEEDLEIYLDPYNLAVGVLSEPVTLPGFVPAEMNDDPDVPQEAEELTVVGYGGDPRPLGLNLTAWPGPALEAPMTAIGLASCAGLSIILFGVLIFVPSALLCALAVAPDEAYPCNDDLGGPVFDVNQKLMGFTYLTNCDLEVPATVFVKASYFKNDAAAVACRLSTSDNLPFPCPDFTCPIDTVQPGYPWVELLDVRPATKARNGFAPTNVTQYPPPGTIVRFDSATDITVTAIDDATQQTKTCTARVAIPQLIPCGMVEMFNLTAGSYSKVGKFTPNRTIVTGTVFKMKGSLQDSLSGRGSYTARLRKGSSRYTGSLVIKGNQTKGALNNLRITEPFSFLNASESLLLDLEVKNSTNRRKNVARYVVFCQEVIAARDNTGSEEF